MPLRSFDKISYLPLLEVRPAEMLALQELPNKDKDQLFPLFKLRPWVSAERLESARERIATAFGNRPCFLEVGEPEAIQPGKTRAVHEQLHNLRNPAQGYRNWLSFLQEEGNENFVPALQLSDPSQYQAQAVSAFAMGRGLLVRLDAAEPSVIGTIATLTGASTGGGKDVVFVLDFGKQLAPFASGAEGVGRLVSIVLSNAPLSKVAVSASSFPDSFTNIAAQAIFERILFDRIASKFPAAIYSDRGGARAEKQSGGGGAPAPRIDFAKAKEWVFFRQDEAVPRAFIGYQRQAVALMNSNHWDSKLKLWGCQMIEKTALGDDSGISSPNRSTAARINIHLHQQLWYGNEAALYDTDEEWTD